MMLCRRVVAEGAWKIRVEREKIRVDARRRAARRRLPGRMGTRRRVCWIRVRNRRDARADHNALQLRDERQTPVGMAWKAEARI